MHPIYVLDQFDPFLVWGLGTRSLALAKHSVSELGLHSVASEFSIRRNGMTGLQAIMLRHRFRDVFPILLFSRSWQRVCVLSAPWTDTYQDQLGCALW